LERSPYELNHAIDWAATICASRGMKTLLVLPADLPLLKSQEIEEILAQTGPEAGIVICPSKEGTGTNALLRTPPRAIPACFGDKSFPLHCRAAKRLGLGCTVLSLPGIAFDIDTPEDLRIWKNASGPYRIEARGFPFLVP
jgi:2-phospho-L-lactate guanylyltransferase